MKGVSESEMLWKIFPGNEAAMQKAIDQGDIQVQNHGMYYIPKAELKNAAKAQECTDIPQMHQLPKPGTLMGHIDSNEKSNEAMFMPGSIPMPLPPDCTVVVNVSTLHGNFVTVRVPPKMPISAFKEKCMACDQWHCGNPIHQISPLSINKDLAAMKQKYDARNAITVSTWSGEVLPDGGVLDEDVLASAPFFKPIFMKNYSLSEEDTRIAYVLLDNPQHKK